jgi:FKBP-type peptidyl-prolyl cis-trans isomerase FklB
MKKYIRITGAGLFALAMIFSSCVSTPDYTPPDYDAALTQFLEGVDKAKLASDKAIIDDSLHAKWGFNDVLVDPKGGVRYRILNPGAGEKPVLTSSVLFKYKGMLFKDVSVKDGMLTGKTFGENQSPGSNDYSPVYGLIAGMQTVLPLLPEGTTVQLFIPSGLGYGSAGVTNSTTGEYIIPKDANLVFEVTMVDVYTQQQ